MVKNNFNTPPRSPEMAEVLELDQDDILEVIELDNLGEDMNFDDDDDDDDDVENMINNVDEPIFLPEREDALVVLKYHEACVLSCTFHPTKENIVVTGGMDEKACVVNISNVNGTLEPSLVTTCGIKESVDCVKFSTNGQYLAIVDVDGLVKIYSGDDFSLKHEFELGDEYRWLSWHHASPIFVTATKSLVSMYYIPTQATKIISVCNEGSINCGKLFPDGKRLAYGTTSGAVRTVDMKTGSTLCSVSLRTSPDLDFGVYALDIHKDGSAIICGCNSGDISLINPDTSKVITFPKKEEQVEAVDVIKYAKTEEHKNMAASGHLSGNLNIWDTARQALRCEYQTGSTIVSLKWHPSEPILFTCQTEPKALMLDARNGTLLRTFLGHTRMLLSIDVSGDASHLLTTSDDNTARLFSLKEEATAMES